ncbi:cobaltochelatase subunit CobN [Methylobacterium aquaticum]|uniref:Cobalamin biosynthesis protein CobN n=1 Tax=Methylobacterium aquaticum TaxID=270351 RepID=A0A0C6FJ86_9HYPH|nr:cobaltochelatase subunit CobN [Methylobacterium aquaticum]BAQ45179.1 cobalamin biosynthesis protein CobN [Methylobacterium aquaticum]BCT74152.1 cobalamin biosynthesis protein CobN and related Mg-chelatases [Methylobacterium aquaticum]
MHLLRVDTVSLDEGEAAVDLGQAPGDIIALSFTDSDLAGLAGAYASLSGDWPSLRLAKMAQLRHPLSVDLYADAVIARARFVLVRCLGGMDYWRYGLERLAETCRAHGIPFVVLPGCDRPDPRLAAISTVAPELRDALDGYVRAGGIENLRGLLTRIAAELGRPVVATPPRALPRGFAWCPGCGPLDALGPASPLPRALVLVYRSAILGGDTAPAAALAAALWERGLSPTIVAVASLKDPEAVAVVREAVARHRPAVIVAATAFSARDDAGFVLDAADCPVVQAFTVGSGRDAWAASARGLNAADLAMQVALPEFDGRLSGFPISHKEEAPEVEGFRERRAVPDFAGIAATADRAAAWARLAGIPRGERRLALVLSDYPARGGRAGFAVGLDTPASTTAILDLLRREGYAVTDIPEADALMRRLTEDAPDLAVPLAAYEAWRARLPAEARAALAAEWGMPADDASVREGAFRFRAVRAGRVLVALQPDRGHKGDRKAGYHDPDAVPCHAYLAFHLALRGEADALIHLGTHGTTEWLPGKAVALSPACWPALAVGALPVVYPFIVDDPGEAAPAKRRIGAVTIGHLPPETAAAGLDPEAATLRELVEEYSAATVLDPRRAALIARGILERAGDAGLLAAAGIDRDTPMPDALAALDAHLCDLAEVTMRDGLHVFGTAPEPHAECGPAERAGLLAALDARFVAPGPAGSPARGRADVLPTGRNLATLDPRALPTRAATMLGDKAAAEVVRRYLQDEGEYPARLVMDLWASPTLRTGGEDVAQALALMGVRPTWDHASTRVTGFEVLPLALLDRPRIDVTVRVSGAFRDTFPDTLALLDRAARAVASREEEDADNPLAAARRRGEAPARVFGAAPGRYGAGTASLALDGEWSGRGDLARAYLDATAEATGAEDADFAARVGAADAYLHAFDVAERDLLDGDAGADAMGGFSAAAASLGAAPALYSLDTSRPEAPKARTAREDVARLVRGRLTHPRWIAAQLRHGWRGAQELAQGLDAVFVMAAATDAVADAEIDRLYDAYLGDPEVLAAIEAANPGVAEALRCRFAELRDRGLWQSRRNSLSALEPREAAE